MSNKSNFRSRRSIFWTHPVLRFFSSVQLAVPLMAVLAMAVAWGTIVESRYNSDLARLQVYHALWFEALLGLLWLNIFLATIARWPFQKRHLGFVITHAGLLILLIGGLVTGEMGIDGQLRVVEGASNASFAVSDLAVEIASSEGTPTRVQDFERVSHRLQADDLRSLNQKIGDVVTALEFKPSVESRDVYQADESASESDVAVGFLLQSQFFKTSEWLHTKEKPDIQLGPAHLLLQFDPAQLKSSSQKPVATHAVTASQTKAQKQRTPKASSLALLDRKSGATLAEFSIDVLEKGPQRYKEFRIVLKRKFEEAVVAKDGTHEGGTPGKNPAVEVEIESQGKKVRDFSYARFPTFSLNPNGVFGMTVAYRVRGIESGANDASESSEMAETKLGSTAGGDVGLDAKTVKPTGLRGQGNEVVFHLFKAQPDVVRVELFKDGKRVLNEVSAPGKTIQTPWMGMTITIGSIVAKSRSARDVIDIEPPMRSPMPPSAMRFQPSGGGESFWLVEGESRVIQIRGAEYEVYFGRKILELPFKLQLQKFSKIDYPGTQTPISYESDVLIDGRRDPVKISMNEPLKERGYTLYQSSFEMNPGEPAASIFSVNYDPGRTMKYFGSIVLCIGIVVFTLMRSRLARKVKK